MAQPILRADYLNNQFIDDLEQHLYGIYPTNQSLVLSKKIELMETQFQSFAKIDLYQFKLRNENNQKERAFSFVLLSPLNHVKPTPLILTQNFCPNHDVVPVSGIPKPDNIGFSCSGSSIASNIMTYLFGRHIVSPPIETIISNGYSIGVLYPPEVFADSRQRAFNELNDFYSDISAPQRPGTLMAWASLSVLIAEYFESSTGIDEIISWGHSRYGKTALLAGLYSPDIDGIISHQSGTGGASLFREKPGETLADILGGYPHWFGLGAQDYINKVDQLPFDQHHLIAALSPKPILLGNARRDVWSDPEGSFRAAQAASDFNSPESNPYMKAEKLDQFLPDDNLSFWIRPGTHGVVKEDWEAFMHFLNAHFK